MAWPSGTSRMSIGAFHSRICSPGQHHGPHAQPDALLELLGRPRKHDRLLTASEVVDLSEELAAVTSSPDRRRGQPAAARRRAQGRPEAWPPPATLRDANVGDSPSSSWPARFLGMVSHELRAPLTSIKGSAATVLGARVRRSARSPRPLLARPRCPGRRRTRDRHRGQALVEEGGRDQRRAPADRGDGRRAGGGRDRVTARRPRGRRRRRPGRRRHGVAGRLGTGCPRSS